MASLLDPYTPQETANLTQGRPIAADPGTIPPIPGMDAPYSSNPAAAAYQHGAQAYAQGAQQLQQERLKTQYAQDQHTAGTRVQAFANDPKFAGRGWSQLTPEERQQKTAEIQQVAPTAIPDIPGLWNTAQSAAAGRPVGVNVQEGEIVSAKGPEGATFNQLQPTGTGGTQTDENGNPIPTNKDSIIQGVLGGQFPVSMLTTMARKNPQMYAAIIGEIHQKDPTWTPQEYAAREKARESFYGNAKNAQSIQSSNLFAEHAGQAFDLIDGMNNSTIPGWNHFANKLGDLAGTKNSTARQQFDTAAHTMATEYAKALSGGVPNEAEIRAYEKLLDPALGPATLKANIQQMAHAVNARLGNLQNEWDTTVKAPRQEGPFLSKQSRDTLERMGVNPATPTTQGAQGPTGAPQVQQVDSQQQYDALPKGAQYRDSHGRIGTKR